MEHKKRIYPYIFIMLLGLLVPSCNDEPNPGNSTSGAEASNDGTPPSFSQSVVYWGGETAQDKSMDIPGNDADIYHEANTFRQTVDIVFSDDGATVSSSNSRILTYTDGGYVTVDFQTNGISGVNIRLSGSTTNGGLKIYGASKFKLDLNGVSIVSKKGPAINSQCKKRVFVNLADGSVNKLVDAAEYADDSYYRPDADSSTEDRKGCLFAEGNIIFSGAGTLEVKGKYRHGIATDDSMVIRPGTTIAVTEAKNNCVQIKGSASEASGLLMKGGYLYCLATSSAGKAVKSDLSIVIDAGALVLNTTGDAFVDDFENDTSSSACLKSDSFVEINGGNLALRSTGLGGKGINASEITVTGGVIGISTSGEKFVSGVYSSSPKGMTAEESIVLNGGNIIVKATGSSDGAKGIACDGDVTIVSGEIEAYSYDDAINAVTFTMSGGSLSAYSIDGDGIRGKEQVAISAGKITASAGAKSSGISCNLSDSFRITGGDIFALGGKIKSRPASSNLCGVYEDITISKGNFFDLINAAGNAVISFMAPRSYVGATVLVASESLDINSVISTSIRATAAKFAE